MAKAKISIKGVRSHQISDVISRISNRARDAISWTFEVVKGVIIITFEATERSMLPILGIVKDRLPTYLWSNCVLTRLPD